MLHYISYAVKVFGKVYIFAPGYAIPTFPTYDYTRIVWHINFYIPTKYMKTWILWVLNTLERALWQWSVFKIHPRLFTRLINIKLTITVNDFKTMITLACSLWLDWDKLLVNHSHFSFKKFLTCQSRVGLVEFSLWSSTTIWHRWIQWIIYF